MKHSPLFLKSSLAVALATCIQPVFADDATLPTIQVAAKDVSNEHIYAAKTAPAVLRSNVPLFETAQSVSVITRQQIDQKQAKTVAEALEGVAGVSSGPYGRRGTDDFLIRGQVSSAQTYIDGLRIQTSDTVLRAEDIYGLQSIEVVKGPTSVGFGMALPGGLVNLTTKRPQAENFNRASLSYGSYNLKEGAFDLNYAPNNTEKGAVRLVGHVVDQNDPTDEVYFKNYYIAPSYNFDLGEKDDLSVIASYQHRDFIRQQGIPYSNGDFKKYSHNLFFGEPDYGYNVDVYRVGTNYAHYFDNNWVFKQNFAVTKTHTQGNPILAQNNAKLPDIKRMINNQDKQDTNYALDNNVQKSFNFGRVIDDFMLGLDMMYERSDYFRRNDTINDFHANNPSYGITSLKEGKPAQNITYNQYMGVYLRNTIKIDDKWIIGLSGRHDWTQVKVNDLINSSELKNSDNAFTGSATLMYRINDQFSPYISYATSFMPVTDLGANNELLSPEKGKQAEVGVKFQGLDQRLQGYLAYYDLTRKNVTEADSSLGYSLQTGEQKTKGLEFELAAALTDQWNTTFTYSYIPTAKTTQSLTVTDIGKRTNHVAKNAGTLSTQYYFSPDKFGWNIGVGVRYQGDRTAQRGTAFVNLPGYAVYDVNAGYETKNWGVGLSIKNLFDRDYLAGTTPNAQLVNWGDPRMVRLNVKFNY